MEINIRENIVPSALKNNPDTEKLYQLYNQVRNMLFSDRSNTKFVFKFLYDEAENMLLKENKDTITLNADNALIKFYNDHILSNWALTSATVARIKEVYAFIENGKKPTVIIQFNSDLLPLGQSISLSIDSEIIELNSSDKKRILDVQFGVYLNRKTDYKMNDILDAINNDFHCIKQRLLKEYYNIFCKYYDPDKQRDVRYTDDLVHDLQFSIGEAISQELCAVNTEIKAYILPITVGGNAITVNLRSRPMPLTEKSDKVEKGIIIIDLSSRTVTVNKMEEETSKEEQNKKDIKVTFIN